MVARERDTHDLARHELPVDHGGTRPGGADGEDRRLRRVDDRLEVGDVEHAQVGDREGGALDLALLELAGAGAPGQVARLAADLAHRLGVGLVQHRHDQAVVEGDRDADVGVRVVDVLAVHVGAVRLGVLDQGQRRGAHDQVVDADLVAGVGKAAVQLGSQLHGPGHVDLGLDVEVGDGLLGLGHARRHGLQHRRQLADLTLGRSALGGWGRVGCRRPGQLAARDQALHVCLDDAALGAAAPAGHGGQVDARLIGHAAGDRRDAKRDRGAGAVAGRGLCLRRRLRRLAGRRGLRLWLRLGSGLLLWWLRGATVSGRRGLVGGLALGAHDRDRCAQGDRLAVADQDPQHRAGVVGLELHGGLVGLDLGQHVTRGERVALVHQPAADGALLHRV